MTLDTLRHDLAAALSAAGVPVSADYPDTEAACPTVAAAVLGLKSVTLKPLCFGEGLASERGLRRAELTFSLDIRAESACGCVTALNNLSAAALTLNCGGLNTPEVSAGAAAPEKFGGAFRLSAELKTAAVMEVKPEAEAEIISLDFTAKVTV